MKKLAVLITAFKSENYILGAINSLKKQKLPCHWQVNFYIGIDDCPVTAKTCKENNIPYYYSYTNVGTYVLTNSLINESQKDNCNMFLRFDSDDFACENFLYDGIAHTEKKGFLRNGFVYTDENLSPLDNKHHRGVGSVFFTKDVLEKIGGYKSYRVGCDNDLRRRCEKFKLKGIVKNNLPIYLRRKHSNSLTGKLETGHESRYRQSIEDLMKQERSTNKNLKITPKLTKLIYSE